MKRNGLISFVSVVAIFCFVLIIAAPLEALAGDKPIKLIINNTWPATHHFAKNVYEPWAKEVEKKTNGRVKVEIYHGGILGKMTSVIEDVAAGKYQVACNMPGYQYKQHILPVIGEVPFAFPSVYVSYKVLKKLTDKYANIVDKEFSDVSIMGFVTTDPYIFYSRVPIRSVNDLKGKLVSLKTKSFKPVIKNWGADPVSVGTAEAYTALQRGTIDVLTYSPAGGVAYKFYEVGPYVTYANLWNVVLCFVMDKKWLNSLPGDLQKLFKEDLNPRMAELATYNDYGPNGEKVKKILKEKAT